PPLGNFQAQETEAVRVEIEREPNEIAQLVERVVVVQAIAARLDLKVDSFSRRRTPRSSSFMVRVDFDRTEDSGRCRQIQQISVPNLQAFREKIGLTESAALVRRNRQPILADLVSFRTVIWKSE